MSTLPQYRMSNKLEQPDFSDAFETNDNGGESPPATKLCAPLIV